MKKVFKMICVILILGLFLTIIDFISISHGNKPIFAIEVTQDNSLNKVYRGIFLDTYNCASYSAYQIKFKLSGFECPEGTIDNDKNNREDKSIAKLTLVGDLLFEQPFYDAISNGDDKNEYFSLVKDYFGNDDLSIGNMEVVIGNDNLESSGVGYNFCAPEYIGHLVNTLDFEILGTANNHAYDRGIEGVNSTINFFENNTEIMAVGTFRNEEERKNLKTLNVNDIKFGFLAYTYGTNQKPNSNDKSLISYYKDPLTKQITDEYKNTIQEEIKMLKREVDVIVVLMHWGKEFTYTPNDEQKEMANYLNSLGVDIIVGSHSHSIQPIEIIGDNHKTLVYYSLGNFVSADDDIARTPDGVEEFDNAYQVGLLSTLKVVKENNEISFQDIKTELTINYFDTKMRNFKIIPYEKYNAYYEKNHYRYQKGLTKEFIDNIYNQVIDDNYQS